MTTAGTSPTPFRPPSEGGGKIVGAILAGGLSTRMGEPKHALRLPDGRTMIEHVHDTIARVCERIVIVGNEEIVRGATYIADNVDHLGPIGGIEALLASGVSHDYLVVPCDMPLITVEIVRAITGRTKCPITALRLAGEPAPAPLPLRINDSILPIIRARIARRELSLHGLLDESAGETDIIDAPVDWTPALTNINTSEEFASLARSLQRDRPIV